jgi:hypothetical protein
MTIDEAVTLAEETLAGMSERGETILCKELYDLSTKLWAHGVLLKATLTLSMPEYGPGDADAGPSIPTPPGTGPSAPGARSATQRAQSRQRNAEEDWTAGASAEQVGRERV